MPSSAILVPLYIYPLPGAWNPLYDVIEAYPDTQFQLIINPHNGPGPGLLPDANYCREIPKLRSHPNVVVYGYVNVVWANRDLDEVCKDVEIYAAWPQHHRAQHDTTQPPHQDQDVSGVLIGIDGLFVDETPIEAGEHEKNFLGTLKNLVESHFLAEGAAPPVHHPLVSYRLFSLLDFQYYQYATCYPVFSPCPYMHLRKRSPLPTRRQCIFAADASFSTSKILTQLGRPPATFTPPQGV